MNVKRIAVLGFAMVAALVAALLVRGLMGGGTPHAIARAVSVPMRQVLVAAVNLQPGQALSADQVKWQNWPAANIDSAFVTRTPGTDIADLVKGVVVRAPLYVGQPVNANAILHGDAAGILAAELQPGMRAISISISADSGVGGFVLPNDRVDIIHTTKSGDHAHVKTILSDVRVLAVDQTYQGDRNTKTVIGKTATLELTPDEAEMVAAAGTTGSLSLTLRGLGDNQTVAANTPRAHGDGPVAIIRYGIAKPASGQNDEVQ